MGTADIMEVLPGNIVLNDQGDIVLSLVVVDREGRRWAGFAVGPSDNMDKLAEKAIASALRLRGLHVGARNRPQEEVREAEAPEAPPSEPPDEGKKKALKYLGALWAEAEKRGINPAELTGRANVEALRDLPLEELRRLYRILHNALTK